MKNAQRKLLKKLFTSFLGIYFLITGVLISGGDALAQYECQSQKDCQDQFPNQNILCYGPKFISGGITYKGTCKTKGSALIGQDCDAYTLNGIPIDCAVGSCSKKAHIGADGLSWDGYCVDDKGGYQPKEVESQTKPLIFTPQVSIPGTEINGPIEVGHLSGTKMMSDLLPRYIGAFYNYGLFITGIIATVTLMGGGIIWLTSAGNDAKITKAKEMIFGSLAGIALLYGAYSILNTISPELVKLKAIESPDIAKITIDEVCCDDGRNAFMTVSTDCVKRGGVRYTDKFVENNKCVSKGCCIKEVFRTAGMPTTEWCHETTLSLCEQSAGSTRIKYTGETCSQRVECFGKDGNGDDIVLNECDGKKDGTDCSDGNCYDGVCQTKKGQLGEKCGDDGGFCTVTWFQPVTHIPMCLVGQHDTDGRNCDGVNLRCCTTK